MSAFDQDDVIRAIARNPKAFGLPTYQEFRRNPAKWRLKEDQEFQSADNQTPLKKIRKKIHYFQRTLEQRDLCGSIEKVEAIAREEGLGLFDLTMKPELREDETTGYFVEVVWWPKYLVGVKKMLDENPITADVK